MHTTSLTASMLLLNCTARMDLAGIAFSAKGHATRQLSLVNW